LPPDDPFEPIIQCSLVRYAEICRDLVRNGNGPPSAAVAVLAAHGLEAGEWAEIQRGWSARIRASEAVRVAFRELYARSLARD
jgi:hypothetical protein